MPITKEKTTGDLEGEIKNADSAGEYLSKNSEYLLKQSISDTLNEVLYRTGKTIPIIIKRSGLTRSYVYHIFNGKRMPSRDTMIAISFGMELSCDETNALLKKCRFAPLYSKDARDAVIIFNLSHNRSIIETNYDLEDQGFELLN